MLTLSIAIVLFFIIVFYLDLKYRWIPNRLTLTAILFGWIYTFHLDQTLFIESVGATFVGFVLLLYPYLKGGIGGGDVKFLAAIGSLGGLHFLLYSLLWGGIVSLFYSLFVIYKNEGMQGIKKYLSKIWKPASYHKEPTYYIPLGSCISVGGILLMISQMW